MDQVSLFCRRLDLCLYKQSLEETMIEPTTEDKAVLYDRYRLPYPIEMVDDLLAQIGGAEIAADMGAGTGQLARLFAEKCRKVYAVEPDDSMRKVALRVLKNHANIDVIDGTAEQTML